MSAIKKLTKKIKEFIKNANTAEKDYLLFKAGIIDENGNFFEKFFSKETIEKDKAYRLGLATHSKEEENFLQLNSYTNQLLVMFRDIDYEPGHYNYCDQFVEKLIKEYTCLQVLCWLRTVFCNHFFDKHVVYYILAIISRIAIETQQQWEMYESFVENALKLSSPDILEMCGRCVENFTTTKLLVLLDSKRAKLPPSNWVRAYFEQIIGEYKACSFARQVQDNVD